MHIVYTCLQSTSCCEHSCKRMYLFHGYSVVSSPHKRLYRPQSRGFYDIEHTDIRCMMIAFSWHLAHKTSDPYPQNQLSASLCMWLRSHSSEKVCHCGTTERLAHQCSRSTINATSCLIESDHQPHSSMSPLKESKRV